jgi:O-antigen ligase
MPGIIFKPLVIFLIFFSCLFYGSVTAFPVVIIEIIAVAMVLGWLLAMLFKSELSFVKAPFILPVFLFLGLVVLQLAPLPLGVIRLLSGNTAYLYERFMPDTNLKAFFRLSIYPGATLAEFFKLAAYAGIFFLLINKLRAKRDFDIIINAIIFFGVAISLFGIIQKYTYSGRVYWFDPPNSAQNPFGPFVYRNNFAGYINMIIPLALTYALIDMPLSRRVIYGFCAGIMSVALFLSLSRAGILIYIASLIFLLVFSRFKESLKARTKVLGAGLALISVLFILLMDTKIVWSRLSTLFRKETFVVFGHGYSWWDILRIWSDFPLFGTGLGTFASISAMYKTTGAQSAFSWAHNDYLQLLSETGLLGFLLVALFFVLYLRRVIILWFNRHDSYVVCLVLGGLSSLFGMLVYSALDFNLHIPAVSLLFFIIMALTYRLAILRLRDERHG